MIRRLRTPRPIGSRRVLFIRQDAIPADSRPWRQIVAQAQRGDQVDVICLRDPGERLLERDGAIRLIRLPFGHHNRGGVLRYLWAYFIFTALSALLATLLDLWRRYDLIEVHSMPDTLVFAAAVPKLLGARVTLDLHEVMPEFAMSKYGFPRDHRFVRLMGTAEQVSIRFADYCVTCTNEMVDCVVERGADRNRIGVVLNSADEDVWDVATYPPRGGASDTFDIVCHGSIEDRYGIDTGIRALDILRDELPDVRFRVIGRGSERERYVELVRELGLEDRVTFSDGFVPMPVLLEAVAAADVGLVAMKRDDFRDVTHCLKMFDYLALRTPMLMSRTRSVENYFDADSFEWFESDDPASLADGIRRLHADETRRARLAEHAAEVAAPYRWPAQRRRYLSYVDELLSA